MKKAFNFSKALVRTPRRIEVEPVYGRIEVNQLYTNAINDCVYFCMQKPLLHFSQYIMMN